MSTNRVAQFIYVLLLTAVFSNAQPGSISGSVVGPDAKPVSSPAILFSQLPTASVNGTALSTGFVRAQSDGNFTIPNLAAGTYQLCVHAGKGFLDPCLWSAPKPTATVTSGKTTAGVQIQLAQAVLVQIRVKDPHNHLPANENKGPGSELIFAIRTRSGLLHAGGVVSTDSSGRNLEIPVPAETDLNLAILSNRFKTADDSGKSYGKGSGDYPVRVPKGQQSVAVNMTITGLK